jgi:hypothetical protein
MSVLPRHREADWQMALEQCRRLSRQGEPKFLDMAIVWDMDMMFSFNTTFTKVAAGDVIRKKLFSDMGVVVCKKSEATLLIQIGEMQSGCWLIGKYKNYWLKNKES